MERHETGIIYVLLATLLSKQRHWNRPLKSSYPSTLRPEISNCAPRTKIQVLFQELYSHPHTTQLRLTRLDVLGVEVQAVGDFRDIHRSVVGHPLLLLGHMHNLLHRFLLVIGPDLCFHTWRYKRGRSVTATSTSAI